MRWTVSCALQAETKQSVSTRTHVPGIMISTLETAQSSLTTDIVKIKHALHGLLLVIVEDGLCLNAEKLA